MSITSFDKTFGKVATQNNSANTERPKAKFWLNVGYMAGEGEDAKFISLPTGIPLDTQEHVSTKSSNEDFRAMRSAQNDLLDQLIEFAEGLEPGAEGIIQLQVQLRRVKDDVAPVPADENKYARKLSFA